jgi:hypothetical protein
MVRLDAGSVHRMNDSCACAEALLLIPAASSWRLRPSRSRTLQRSRVSGCGVQNARCPMSTSMALLRPPRLEDAADNFAVRQHVEVVIAPFAGGTRGQWAFQSEVVILHRDTVARSFWRTRLTLTE